MIVVSGVLKMDPANHDAFAELGKKMAASSMAEDGCVAYGFWADSHEPGVFRVFEEYADEDALNSHMGSPHFMEFLGSMGTVGITEASVDKYHVSEKAPLM